MKRMRSVESDSVKSARKAKDKLHKACECERASETRDRTLYRQEQNRMRMASMRESETFERTVQRKERDRMHHILSKNTMPTCAVLRQLKPHYLIITSYLSLKIPCPLVQLYNLSSIT